uniref:Uncharacterized protein n=1 Tax=Arundo donax TaxID=35708 RepID=A0A0A9AJ76_ARUDO
MYNHNSTLESGPATRSTRPQPRAMS